MAGSKASENKRFSTSPPSQDSEGAPGFKFKGKKFHERLTLSDVRPELLIEALDAALDQGVLVGLTRTTDGGAIGVFITNKGVRENVYAASTEEAEQAFEDIRDYYSS